MQFRADQYYRVSLERMEQAKKLYHDHDGSSFALAMYCGGLAVESMLRAFRWTDDTSFEGRHDLHELVKSSRILKFDEDHLRRKGASEEILLQSALKMKGAVNEVAILWHNNLRYASEMSLLAFLKQSGRTRGVKGDPLKKNALDLVEAAQSVIDRGIALWTSAIK